MFQILLKDLDKDSRGTIVLAIGFQLMLLSWFVIPLSWFTISFLNALFWSLFLAFIVKGKMKDAPRFTIRMLTLFLFGLHGGATAAISIILYIVTSYGSAHSVGM